MTTIGLKELREHTAEYIVQVQKGKVFIVQRHNKPLFQIAPVQAEDDWEEVIDFTKLKRGGVRLADLLKRL